MATTSSIQVTSGTIVGQGGNSGKSGRFNLRAKVAVGAVALGCAAALAFGGLRASDAARTRPRIAPTAPSVQAGGYGQQRFAEENIWLPTDGSQVAATSYAQQRFLEENVQLPAGLQPVAATTYEQQLFLKENLWLPDSAPVAAGSTFEQQRLLEQNLSFPASAAPATIPSAERGNLR